MGIPSVAQNTMTNEVSNELSYQTQYSKKDYQRPDKRQKDEVDTLTNSDVPPEGYNQSVIDEINNNPIGENSQEELSSTNGDNPNKVLSQAATAINAMVGDEFQVDPINSPFNMQNSENEFVSLATGDMSYQKSLLSLPGRNGLNLDISIKYNSGSATITKNEFETSYYRDNGQNFNRFAIGWSFGFSTIVKGRQFYGYHSPLTLNLANGESYEIQGDPDSIEQDTTLTLKNYKLNDLSLVRKADTEEYVLTYSDGKKEYFNGTYGYITKIEDRFNNTILFEYSDVEYFRGTFIDYISNPSIYKSTLKVLSKITDSAGRVIEFDYNIGSVLEGKTVKSIKIKMNGIVYATITLDNVSCYNGKIDTVKEISDAEGYKTKFTYKEEIAHILNSNTESGAPSYMVNGSAYLLKQIDFPTGGYSAYEYEKARRSYSYYTPNVVKSDWYEVFKVSKRSDSSDYTIRYQYENDQSGYPYSYLKNGSYTDDTGEIEDENVRYSTIVTERLKNTIYTFDYQHKMITKQIYDSDNSVNSYIGSKGTTGWNVVVNNQIYRISNVGSYLCIYKQSQSGTPTLLSPYDGMVSIKNVKTQGNLIYVFYKAGDGYISSPYKLGAKVFDTLSESWSEGGEWQLPEDIKNTNINKMYYTNGVFYSSLVSSSKLYHIVYNPYISDVNSRWICQEISSGIPSYLYHICNLGNNIYYSNNGYIYKYDMASNSITSKQFSGLNPNKQLYGFSAYNRTFLYNDEGIYEFNFDSGNLVTSFSYPFELAISYKFQKGSDGNLYYFNTQVLLDESMNYIYQFNPTAEQPWKVITYRLFDCIDTTNIIMGHQSAYLTLGNMSGIGVNTMTPNQNCGGFEKIDLNPSTVTKSRYRINHTYNSYNQMIKSETIIFDGNKYKVESTESWDYLAGRSALISETDKLGNTTKYEYTNSSYYIPTKIRQYADTENELVTDNILSEDQKVTVSSTTAYDDRNQIVLYTYDLTYPGNLITQTEKVQRGENESILNVSQNNYDSNGVFVTSVTAKDVVTNGDDYTLASPINITTSKTYNELGLIASETDANGGTTNYTYYKNGWLKKTVSPDSSFVEQIYSISPNASKMTTSYNNKYYKVDYYDGLGRVIKQSEKSSVNGTETILNQYRYNGNRIDTVTTANGHEIWYDYYDAFNRILRPMIWGSNLYTESLITYDDYNRKITIETGGDLDENGQLIPKQTTISYYDIANRKIQTEIETSAGINTVSYDYDYRGQNYLITDANLNVTHFEYDDIGNLLKSTNAAGQSTTYEYDDKGNTTKMTTYGGSSTTYQYDTLNRVIKQTDAMGQSEFARYDNNGNLLGVKDKKNQITNYTYDNMNRVTNKSTDGLNVSNTYDIMGNKTKMVDGKGTTNYTYKYNNLLESITTPDNKNITYGYDALGNITNINDYNGNQFTYSYEYNGEYLLSGIKKSGTSIADYYYDQTGSILKVTYPQGQTEYTYDNAGQVLSLTNKLANGSVLNQYTYEYDILGNQTKKTETSGSVEKVTEYTYDPISRLTSETENDGTKTEYFFDMNNNIQSKKITHPSNASFSFTQDGTNYSISNLVNHEVFYAYNKNNQLKQQRELLGGTSDNYNGFIEVVKDYDYDANGNTIRQTTSGQADESVVEYTYNQWNQMTQYKGADGSIATYTYDGTGMRTSKTYNDVTTKFYWDRGYISNEAVDGTFTANNYIGAQGIFARESGDTTNYMFKNGHGDVVKLVSNGTVTQNYDFDAYGNQKGESNTADTNPFRYCGEYFDQESGLIYLRARYYDPSAGRFTSEDPIQDGDNWYIYASNNPILYSDPFGLYNRWLAVSYAMQYATCTNPYYQRFDTAFSFMYSFGMARGDCANFVSQCLVAGGIAQNDQWKMELGNFEMIPGNPNSTIRVATDYTATWAGANAQYQYFSNPNNGYSQQTLCFHEAKYIRQWVQSGIIRPGDLLYWDFNGDGVIDHASIIVGVTDNDIIYAQHTTDKSDGSLYGALSGNEEYYTYVVIMND